MAVEQGTGPYPGPNHTPAQDIMDWITATDLGPRVPPRPRLTAQPVQAPGSWPVRPPLGWPR